LTAFLPGTQEQIEQYGEAWWLVASTMSPDRWYLGGYYSRMRGDSNEQHLGDDDEAVQFWLEGWNDAHWDLTYG
jgi:hypothetical protein